MQPHTAYFTFGTAAELEDELLKNGLDAANWAEYEGQKIVLKGCGEISAAVPITHLHPNS